MTLNIHTPFPMLRTPHLTPCTENKPHLIAALSTYADSLKRLRCSWLLKRACLKSLFRVKSEDNHQRARFSSPITVCANKVLLECSCVHVFTSRLWLRSYYKGRAAVKTYSPQSLKYSAHYSIPQERSLPTSVLEVGALRSHVNLELPGATVPPLM